MINLTKGGYGFMATSCTFNLYWDVLAFWIYTNQDNKKEEKEKRKKKYFDFPLLYV